MTKRPKYSQHDIDRVTPPSKNIQKWERENGITTQWETPEHINVKSVYTRDDLNGMEHLGYAAGLPPYLRGPYSAMYA
ncbi:MAG: methylmalonyl-CoA mutase family protein, partial [Bacteroidales bacterium]